MFSRRLLRAAACKIPKRLSVLSLVLVLPLTSPLVATAQKLKPGQAADIAQRQHGGKVLKVSPVRTATTTTYRVKLLLPSGQITHIAVDGDNGRVLGALPKGKEND